MPHPAVAALGLSALCPVAIDRLAAMDARAGGTSDFSQVSDPRLRGALEALRAAAIAGQFAQLTPVISRATAFASVLPMGATFRIGQAAYEVEPAPDGSGSAVLLRNRIAIALPPPTASAQERDRVAEATASVDLEWADLLAHGREMRTIELLAAGLPDAIAEARDTVGALNAGRERAQDAIEGVMGAPQRGDSRSGVDRLQALVAAGRRVSDKAEAFVSERSAAQRRFINSIERDITERASDAFDVGYTFDSELLVIGARAYTLPGTFGPPYGVRVGDPGRSLAQVAGGLADNEKAAFTAELEALQVAVQSRRLAELERAAQDNSLASALVDIRDNTKNISRAVAAAARELGEAPQLWDVRTGRGSDQVIYSGYPTSSDAVRILYRGNEFGIARGGSTIQRTFFGGDAPTDLVRRLFADLGAIRQAIREPLRVRERAGEGIS